MFMLNQLHIKNVALIEAADISFHEGLNIISGETGAGKSILIDSILFLLGARPDKDFIRSGVSTASVEGLLTVANSSSREMASAMGIETDDEGCIFISRTLSDQGRSVCRVNGRVISVGMLRTVSSMLVDVHGQHEHQSLLNPVMHIKLLDQFCDIESDLIELSESLSCYREIIRSIKTIEGNGRDRESRMEILQFQFDELTEANVQPDEEEALNKRKAVLSSVGRLSKNTRETLRLLDDEDCALPLIATGVGLLREAGISDGHCAEMSVQLTEIQELLADLIKELSLYTENLLDDPETLEEIEDRLDLLYRLKKKYGANIPAHLERIKTEIESLNAAEQELKRLNAEKKKLAAQMLSISDRLSQKRKSRAIGIQNEIESALQFLGMQHARFKVQIERKNEFSQDGYDRVEFMISPNLGEPLKPLAKTASGGEMSRVMLAIKSVIADADNIETFIFDEIDTGVSGRTAQQVAEKLRVLSRKQQILCITHLPQIAAMADSHYLIEKSSSDNKTQTFITELNRDGQIKELARLIGGAQITGATLRAAEEMKDMAR